MKISYILTLALLAFVASVAGDEDTDDTLGDACTRDTDCTGRREYCECTDRRFLELELEDFLYETEYDDEELQQVTRRLKSGKKNKRCRNDSGICTTGKKASSSKKSSKKRTRAPNTQAPGRVRM